MGKANKAQKAKKAKEEQYRLTHLCPKCELNLIDRETTLGHDDHACAAHKAEVARMAARKKKKAAAKKPANKK